MLIRNAYLGHSGAAAGHTDNIIAANRTQVPTSFQSIANLFTSRRSHYASPEADVTNLKFTDLAWKLDVTTRIPVGSSNFTIKKFIEYPANTFHQVKWATASTVAISGGLQATSDVLISSVTGQPLLIPAGVKFWERTVNVSGGTVANFPIQDMPANCSTLGLDDGNSSSDLGNSGTISPTGTPNTFGSSLIKGTVAKNGAKGMALVGNSIVWGAGDVSSVGVKGGSGWHARWMDPLYPWMKIALGGQSIQDVAGNNSSAMANFIAILGNTDVIFEHGINDLSLFSRTMDQILADQQTVYSRYSGTKWQNTLTARSTSSNGYADTAGQTPKTDGNMADLNPTNWRIRALPPQLAGIIEGADLAMPTRDADIWSGPFPPTLDGTHPTSAKAAAMAAAAVFIPLTVSNLRLTSTQHVAESGDASAGWNYVSIDSQVDFLSGGVADKAFQAGTDGWISGKLPSASADQTLIGLSTTNAFTIWQSQAYSVFFFAGGMTYYGIVTAGSSGAATNSVVPQDGDLIRLRRSTTTLIAEVSRDNGVTWIVIHVWSGVSTGAFYPQFQMCNDSEIDVLHSLGLA